jgi:hypothetical protein
VDVFPDFGELIFVSNLTTEQLDEMRRFWESPTLATTRLIEPAELDRLGRMFPPFPGKREYKHEGDGETHDVEESFRAAADRHIARYREQIHDALCKRWEYCKKRKALATEGFQLSVGVADALLTIATGIPLPVTALSVYLVKRGLLDQICGCKA